MKKFMRIASLLLALLMVLSLAACGKKEEAPAAEAGEEAAPAAEQTIKETVVVGNIRDITMINPFGSNTTENLNLFQMTHSRLLESDPLTYEIKPGLAESYEVSEDGLVWTFHLRQGVKFHNGHDLDADDVLYSFGQWKESSFISNKVRFVETCEKLDQYTVQFTLNAPYTDIIYTWAVPNICIVDEEAIAADPDLGYGVGSGAYEITEWSLGDKTVVTRFEDYFGEKPQTKTFEFRLIAEDSSRVIALENGEIDICLQPPATENARIEETDGIELMKVVGNKTNYLALNVEKDIFKDQRVREAIAHCVNRDSIIAAAVEGEGTPANSCIAPFTPGYNKDQTVYEYDLDKAKALLEEAGVNPADLTFTIICNGSVRETIATVIQSDLAKIGVNVEVQNLEASALKAQLNDHQHDACVYNWAPTPGDGTINTLTSLWYSGSGSNRTCIAEPELDKMIDDAAVELDATKRAEMYNEVQKYVIEYGAFIPLYYETITMGATSNLQNFSCDVAEQHAYTYAYVVE